jgi:hypothetical protein
MVTYCTRSIMGTLASAPSAGIQIPDARTSRGCDGRERDDAREARKDTAEQVCENDEGPMKAAIPGNMPGTRE